MELFSAALARVLAHRCAIAALIGVYFIHYILGWRFPNRRGWPLNDGTTDPEHNLGNWYCNEFKTAFAALEWRGILNR